jgi:predicted RNase H-like nuclease (RuvC/YqgF family)
VAAVTDRERTLAMLLHELDGRASPALLRSALERSYDAGAAATAYELGKQSGPAIAEILTERGELRAQAQQDGARIAELKARMAELAAQRDRLSDECELLAAKLETFRQEADRALALERSLEASDRRIAEQARRIEELETNRISNGEIQADYRAFIDTARAERDEARARIPALEQALRHVRAGGGAEWQLRAIDTALAGGEG